MARAWLIVAAAVLAAVPGTAEADEPTASGAGSVGAVDIAVGQSTAHADPIAATLATAVAGTLIADYYFTPPLHDPAIARVDHAVALVAERPGKPVVIADTWDNPGGGVAGDGRDRSRGHLPEPAHGDALAHGRLTSRGSACSGT